VRTLTSTLNAFQKRGTVKPLVKFVVTDTINDGFLHLVVVYTYDKTRIWDVEQDEAPWSQKVVITLDNADRSLTNLDFKGQPAVLSWGLTTSAGDEYSACAPLTIIDQKFVSTMGGLSCVLTCWGIPNMMAEDRASTLYAPTATDTLTVKQIITAVCGAALAPYTHCAVYTVDYDSEDSLINSFQPKDTFRIYKNGSRLAALRRLIDYTGCAVRWGADGHVHVFVPVVSGTVYDYRYML
jgi:hypothetical protein